MKMVNKEKDLDVLELCANAHFRGYEEGIAHGKIVHEPAGIFKGLCVGVIFGFCLGFATYVDIMAFFHG